MGRKIGEFVFYPHSNELADTGGVVRLPARIARLLDRLSTTPGEIVRKDELLNDVWTFVGIVTATYVVGRSSPVEAVTMDVSPRAFDRHVDSGRSRRRVIAASTRIRRGVS